MNDFAMKSIYPCCFESKIRCAKESNFIIALSGSPNTIYSRDVLDFFVDNVP